MTEEDAEKLATDGELLEALIEHADCDDPSCELLCRIVARAQEETLLRKALEASMERFGDLIIDHIQRCNCGHSTKLHKPGGARPCKHRMCLCVGYNAAQPHTPEDVREAKRMLHEMRYGEQRAKLRLVKS